MMTDLLTSGIAINSNCQGLLLPPGFAGPAIDSVREHKAEILRTLRSSQMDAAGFYCTLPGALHRVLQASPWVAVSLQTTSASRYIVPERVSAYTRIGGSTWTAYRAANPGATINVRPRARVLSIYTEALGACGWDLDALTPDDRRSLLDASIENKIVVAHDGGSDLGWIFGESAARPRFVLDSMLLVRQLHPMLLLRPFRTAIAGGEVDRKNARDIIKQSEGKPAASLSYIAAALKMPAPDAIYEPSANWSIHPLSTGHHAYVTATVQLPVEILRRLMPGVDIEAMPDHIERSFPWYLAYAEATVRLAEAHVRGVPFDLEAAKKLRVACQDEIRQVADNLIQIPEFAKLHDLLADPRTGETQEIKQALAAYAIAHDIPMPLTNTGALCTSRSAMQKSGADRLPASIYLEKLKSNKKVFATISQYQAAAEADGRLHSIIALDAATGRTTSSEPSLQNVPRDSRLRSLFKAKDGHAILAADYAAIELRSASVLAERTIADLRGKIKDSQDESWFVECLRRGLRSKARLECPSEPEKVTLDWLNEAIPAVSQVVFRRSEQMMASIFRRGFDAHLVTAIDMASRQGLLQCGSSPVEWLAAQNISERERRKIELKSQRQGAKATNFGLLYGMGTAGLHRYGIDTYGLSWTLEEAASARSAWFALYPEFRLWQWWTKYLKGEEKEAGRIATWNAYRNELVVSEFPVKIYRIQTLTHRPFAVLDDVRQALNYQNQGTGADMLVRAITFLPEHVAAMLLVPVHDELVFEVPRGVIEETRALVVDAMTRAGDAVLGGQVPVEVECNDSEDWSKS